MITMIPHLNAITGQCLTHDNWQELNVKQVLVSLRMLLIKPGLDYLNALSSLGDYLAWHNEIILDASDLCFSHSGVCHIQSPYDGQRIHFGIGQFWALMEHLKPEKVLLPPTFQVMKFGESNVNYELRISNPSSALRAPSPRFRGEGESEMGIAEQNGIFIRDGNEDYLFACDQPTVDGMEGKFYLQDKTEQITEQGYQLDFQPLDPNCHCSTCQQELTRAYLHHLFQSTPLLCQRYLVIHNWATILL